MEWLGHANIHFTSSSEPLPLTDKAGNATDLLRICENSTPPCHLNPILFNGHLQTFFTAVKAEGPPVYYKRRIFDAEDELYQGTYAVDFVVDPWGDHHVHGPPRPRMIYVPGELPARTKYFTPTEFENIGSLDNRPMLITLHGLSGGSYEIYLRHVLAPLAAQKEQPWEICVVNSRGCAGHKITSNVLYHARATWDLRQTVKWLRKTFPNRPLYGIGFSLGANILTNYVGEEGNHCALKAAVVISNPWNLEVSSLALQRTWLGMEIYSRTMSTNMKKLIDLHAEQLKTNPKIDLDAIKKVTYLHEFDREVQCPTWGYPTERSYYRDASSSDSILAARIPLFAINAVDDPIAVNEAIPYEEFKLNPYAVLCTTSLGGHLSWFERGGSRWHAKPAVNFLNNLAFGIDLESFGSSHLNGQPKARRKEPIYSPMRRKLHVDMIE